jgi:peptide/nickel transport system permease protein
VIRYLIRRLGQSVVVVVLVTLITFMLLHLLPGGPAKAVLGVRAQPAAIRAFDVAD